MKKKKTPLLPLPRKVVKRTRMCSRRQRRRARPLQLPSPWLRHLEHLPLVCDDRRRRRISPLFRSSIVHTPSKRLVPIVFFFLFFSSCFIHSFSQRLVTASSIGGLIFGRCKSPPSCCNALQTSCVQMWIDRPALRKQNPKQIRLECLSLYVDLVRRSEGCG